MQKCGIEACQGSIRAEDKGLEWLGLQWLGLAPKLKGFGVALATVAPPCASLSMQAHLDPGMVQGAAL